MLTTKSVASPIDPERDGLRILAARFRGRNLPASRYDVWMASLGPSERLLRLIKHLAQKGNVTLLCHCAEDEPECHRHILKRLIESKQV